MNQTTNLIARTVICATELVVATAMAQSSYTVGKHLIDPELASAQIQALVSYSPEIRVEFGEDQVPKLLSGKLSARMHPEDPVAEAKSTLISYGAAFRVTPDDEFFVRAIDIGENGTTYVRMSQMYKKIPVANGELVVEMSAEEVTAIRGRFVPDLEVTTTSGMSTIALARQAVFYALQHGFQNPRVIETGAQTIIVDHDGGHLIQPIRIQENSPQGSQHDLLTDVMSGQVLATEIRPDAITNTPKNMLLNANFAPEIPSTSFPQTAAECEPGPWYAAVNDLDLWKDQPVNSWWDCASLQGPGGSMILGTTQPNWVWWEMTGTFLQVWPARTELWQWVQVPTGAVSATLTFDLGILADQTTWPLEQITVSILTPAAYINPGVYSFPAQYAVPRISGFYTIGKQVYSNMDAPYAYTYTRQTGNLVEPPAPIIYHASIPLTGNVSWLNGKSIVVDFQTAQNQGNIVNFFVTKPSLTFTFGGPQLVVY